MREKIPRDELIRMLDERIKNHRDGGDECACRSVRVLEEPDVTGCNWSADDGFVARDRDDLRWLAAVMEIIEELQAKYNVGSSPSD